MTEKILEKMTQYLSGNLEGINHFLKVWSFTRAIAESEGLDEHTREVLEMTAIVHDISCPLCMEKYGNTDGKHQEEESPHLIEEFFADTAVAPEDVERISWLCAHHHTYTDVTSIDHQILLEADYLVNAGENGYSRENIGKFLDKVFCTKLGKSLIKNIYLC